MNIFRLFQRHDPPRAGQAIRQDDLVFLPDELIAACHTYREACLLAWEWRREPGMTKLTLAERAMLRHNLVTDYFNEEARDRHGKRRRELPGYAIADVEEVLGNNAISQWNAMRKGRGFIERLAARWMPESAVAA
ncbi:hypothetical protein [Paraburkholderia kururiensis]|uniref:hypothetical protein n=1 Tax=Paraburkholderia kururiensis TaxID=984307 RepID=UPI000344EDB4|nr:hypothetical protein [Paraburkholderia kururiensis]